jgi:NAD(P)-dependent dehydrogenase (short-subunit alcohol dehydrogenase family)
VPTTIVPTKLLRAGLLQGLEVLVAAPAPAGAGGERAELAAAVCSTCAELGAKVSAWTPGEKVALDVDRLVVDGAASFAHAPAELDEQSARTALSACLDCAWEATRAVAGAAFIEAGRGGRVVYLAPATPASAARGAMHADAARAGLENLARTLSIEWARYGVTLVTIAPGERTSAAEVAAATAFLASPAGAYYSGCLFDLRGVELAQPGA